jgi:uncharacterized protein (DUF2236 family)
LAAYERCVRPVADAERDGYYLENQASARLYGVAAPPGDEAAFQRLLEHMRRRLEPSAVMLEFIATMERVPLLPALARPLQRLFMRAAVQCLPAWVRQRLELDGPRWAVSAWQWGLLRAIGRAADNLDHPELPAVLAQHRLAAADRPFGT